MCICYYVPLVGLDKSVPGGEWVEAQVQVALIGRRCAEAMAEILGLELEEFELPEPDVTPLEDMALDKLIAEVQHLPLSEDFADWQRGVLAAIPIYLRNQLHYHVWARDAALNDAAEVLGNRPKDLKVADRELVVFVRSNRKSTSLKYSH